MSEFDRDTGEARVKKPTLPALITALEREATATGAPVSPTVIYGLSDLAPSACPQVEASWKPLPAPARQRIAHALVEASEALFELDFREFAHFCLKDANSAVREAAIELLSEDESPEKMQKFMALAERDPEQSVRAAAIQGLQRCLFLGELGIMPAELSKQAQSLCLRLHKDTSQPLELRRRALESLASSSHPQVPRLIQRAYAAGNRALKLGALYAMGSSCDDVWRDILLKELASDDMEIVYEAIHSCGAILLSDSAPRIAELAESEDREIQFLAIWALGEIGGEQAYNSLLRLAAMSENEEDETLSYAISEAIEDAKMTLKLAALGLSDLDDSGDWMN